MVVDEGNRDILELLQDEFGVMEKTGYGRSARKPWKPKSIFQDSLTYLNFADLSRSIPAMNHLTGTARRNPRNGSLGIVQVLSTHQASSVEKRRILLQTSVGIVQVHSIYGTNLEGPPTNK